MHECTNNFPVYGVLGNPVAPVLLPQDREMLPPCIGPAASAIHRAAEKEHSRKPVYRPVKSYALGLGQNPFSRLDARLLGCTLQRVWMNIHCWSRGCRDLTTRRRRGEDAAGTQSVLNQGVEV